MGRIGLLAALASGDSAARRLVAASLLPVEPGNVVVRPWGGHRLGAGPSGEPVGEVFEVCGDRRDDEAALHPSHVRLPGGETISLPDLLDLAGPDVMGEALHHEHGPNLPLLPKTLDVRNMLSVQTHPPGHPEVYIVLEAEPGATIGLGFAKDVDREELSRRFVEARAAQEAILRLLRPEADAHVLGLAFGPALARRATADETVARLAPLVRPGGPVVDLASRIRTIFEAEALALGVLGRVPVAAGDVLWNATLPESGRAPSAEVHALGDPEGNEVVLLEIRRPGPTYRAWDHARFPLRALDVERALGAASPRARAADSFRVVPRPVEGRPGAYASIASEAFVVEHLRPRPGAPVDVPATPTVETVHATRGGVRIETADGRDLGRLEAGRSALVPAGVGAWRAFHDASEAGPCEVVRAWVPTTPSASLLGRLANLDDLRATVARSEGPREVVAIVNGGDGEIVRADLEGRRRSLFRDDGETRVFAHEEVARRGQWLGLLDALRHREEALGPLDEDAVQVGIMLPGQGTRLAPLTQRLYGIKPDLPLLVRAGRAGERFLSAAAASIFTWTLVSRHLERLGFRGVLWKWGDEPQVPARVLADLAQDLADADAVRFGAAAEVTEDLARNKDWLVVERDTGRLVRPLRRRSRADLLAALSSANEGRAVQALVHVGSPGFSHALLAAAREAFEDVEGWIDVDGWLFEALTLDDAAWAAERERDAGLRALLAEHPDFRARVSRLAEGVTRRRGRPPVVRVVDLDAGLWWGDVGQLSRARETLLEVACDGEVGRFARRLASIDHVVPDRFGNRLVGDAHVPGDGSVRASVVIDARVDGPAEIRGAVLVGSDLGRARIGRGSVVVGTTVLDLETGDDALVFRAVAERAVVPAGGVLTHVPTDPADLARGLDAWRADQRTDLGAAEVQRRPAFGNPASFGEKLLEMRRRDVDPLEVERAIDERFAAPLRARLGRAVGRD